MIEGREADAVPSSFSLHFPAHEAVGDAAVEAHLKFFEETDTDIIKVMNEHLVPCYGMIKSPEDYYDKIPVIDRSSDFIADQLEMTKRFLTEQITMLSVWEHCMVFVHQESILWRKWVRHITIVK